MSDPFVLTGTREIEPKPTRLVAGPLEAELINGNLRGIRYNGVEVLRAIAYVVRDRDWGTYTPVISDLRIDQRGDNFTVTYEADCTGMGGGRLRFSSRIEASAAGLSFVTTATPDLDFETNRCGFCVLHPIVGVAGRPVTVEHVDGTVVETSMPDLLEPWQPFKDMRSITHGFAPGMTGECRMEGDTFEMEDQRNWSDASYKTYVRPLALPWPYVLPAGEPRTQSVTLAIRGRPAAEARKDDAVPSPRPGQEGPVFPAVGVVVYPEDVAATLADLDLLRSVAPQALLFHFDPTRGHGRAELVAFARLATAYRAGVTLECALPCRDPLDMELGAIAAMVAAAGLDPDAVFVSPSVDRQSTPPGSEWPQCPPLDDVYAAVAAAFPNARLGGGMLSYFTELNRKRVPADRLAFVSHCTNPIVHAGDDLSVMQSLESLPFITRSVRAIYGEKPYRIGPSTIAMRQNPYGSATKDNPDLGRIAMARRDPRHNGLFAAAWTVGYAAAVAPAGLEQWTPSAFAGSFGLAAGEGEPARAGTLRPLGQIVRELASLAGRRTVAVDLDDSRLAVLATRGEDRRTHALVANLTPHTVVADVSCFGVEAVEVMDAAAIASGDVWSGRKLAAGRLDLPAYAVARF